jgi:pentatricopeptide repeat protein
LIHSLCKRGLMDDALCMFDRMREKGIRVTAYP